MPRPDDGLRLTPEHPALAWRPLADLAAMMNLEPRTIRAWGDQYGLPLRRHGATWCGCFPFVHALHLALVASRGSQRFGGWGGKGDTASARGVTFRSAWAAWCGEVDVLPDVAGAGFALVGTTEAEPRIG